MSGLPSPFPAVLPEPTRESERTRLLADISEYETHHGGDATLELLEEALVGLNPEKCPVCYKPTADWNDEERRHIHPGCVAEWRGDRPERDP